MHKIVEKIIEGYKLMRIIGLKYATLLFFNSLIHRNETKRTACTQEIKKTFICSRFAHLLEKHRKSPYAVGKNKGPVWVCWWQGEAHMPELVKMCYNSVLSSVSPDQKVCLITKDNYQEFVDLPDYIEQKVNKGIISLTHLSDILRIGVLSKHGGLWIDSTVYVNGKLPDYVFQHSYFSGKAPYEARYVNRCEYTVFLLGAAPNAPWITYARDLLFEYWQYADRILEYGFIDYILISAMDNIPELRKDIEPGLVNMPYIHTMEQLRNEPCDVKLYEKMMAESPFFKLSNKMEFREQTDNGEMTYYGRFKSSLSNNISLSTEVR